MSRKPIRRVGRGANWRSACVRLFALLVAVLALSAQQRVAKAEHWGPASATRVVAERTETVQSNAVRVESSLRVAPAPVLTRLPVALPFALLERAPGERALFTHARCTQLAQLVTHFHSKRRIPRMNSEEPPRG